MSSNISTLAPEQKRVLLAQLLKQQASKKADTVFPLSYGQRGWWILYQLEPQNPAYNIMLPARIRSEVDAPALSRAFQKLIARHASLRTSYTLRDGVPVQKVNEKHEIELVLIDASGWSEAELGDRLVEESHHPFDLEQGPIMRLKLFTRSEREHILMMTVHHIGFDLWSLVVFMHELGELYSAEKEARRAALEPLTCQYGDYVRWQQNMLAGPEGASLWDYWQKQLSGELPALNLPSSRTRPPVQTFRGAAHRFTLDEEVTRRLKALGNEHGATLYMCLLAAYQVLLYRYSGQEDILVGSLVASGRSRAEFAGLVGFFDNQIVLRARLAGNPSFKDFLAQVRQTVLGALDNQQYPFPLLVERIQPARDSSRAPIFQTMFILQRAQRSNEASVLGFGLGQTAAQLKVGGLALESFELDRRVAGGLAGQLDLTLIVAEMGDNLEASLQYNPDLLDACTVERMASHFQNLLASIIEDQEQSVATLALLSEAEKAEQLAEWNDTAVEWPLSCLHQMFEAQAEKTPAAVAAIFDQKQLSYRELNERANQLAHYLRRRGVGPEVRVCICVERSLEMVVALLGVLKAGGAYVPLDPAYPRERLAFMLEDSQAPVMLTLERLAATLPHTEAEIVRLDADWDIIARHYTTNPENLATIKNLAYIIYTSGSTGRPKGVMINHRGAANTIVDMNQRYGVREGDRVLALSSLSFDLSVYDMFGTLASGAAIIIPNPSPTPDPSHWLELILREQATVWNSAPALMEMFVEYITIGTDARPDSLRLVLMSGDWIPVKLPDQIRALVKGIEVHSLGGATEASIWSIAYPITSVDPAWRSIPYGRPMKNQRFHVLDAHLQPLPVGVVGELFIGGIGVAMGYHNRPQLTAERFIPDPFAQRPGSHLYRTGDLGRYMPDGNIEFLGRIDGQVKVRGFRIELGEIEAMLSQHVAIRECVVTVQKSASGERRLVAYVVPMREAASDAAAGLDAHENAAPAGQVLDGLAKDVLRRFLQEGLPDYMIPSAFMVLDALPLTPNGKVDRGALPVIEHAQAGEAGDAGITAPRTPTEEVLAGLWMQVLKLSQVSTDSSFFEAGGDSLLATQLIARVRSTFQIELPLHSLFESPTISGLAEKIDQDFGAKGSAQVMPIERIPRDEPLPLSFSQQRLWFLDQLMPGTGFYNNTAAVCFNGILNTEALEWSVNEIVKRHELLRTTFPEIGGEPVQVIAPALTLPLTVIDLRKLDETERERTTQRLMKDEARAAFDLSAGPLMRITLLRLQETEHVMLLATHHIIFDGWAFGVFLRELSALYEAFLSATPAALPELSIQYADFAHWQREWLQGEVLEDQLNYWRKQLAGSVVTQLPTDRPRPAVSSFPGARQTFVIPAALCDSVKALSRSENVTFFMTLLAAFQTLVHRYTGAEDIVVGSPIANRTRDELDGLIGFFLNALVLRVDLSGDPTFTEILARVRKMALAAYAHQDLPFEKLVEELQPEREAMQTPLFQLWFVLQNAPMPSMSLPELELSMLQVDDGTSRFDLTLSMFETSEGLCGTWIYNTDLFEDATITRMADRFLHLLSSIVAQPQARLHQLDFISPQEKSLLEAEKKAAQESKFKKLKNISRKAIDLREVSVVESLPLASHPLPLLLRPRFQHVDLLDWTAAHLPLLNAQLLRHGALLFRGFNIRSPESFERLAQTLCSHLYADYGDLPRTGLGGHVYASTPYPPDQPILFHNESSQMHCWPRKIFFCCLQAAPTGGQTPLVDGRRVYARLDEGLRERFHRLGVMYVRNFTAGLDVSWQEFFRTTQRSEVESYCERAGIQYEWRAGGGLQTRRVSPAVIEHPETGERVFFNQIQAHHVSCLAEGVRESVLRIFGEEGLPRNVYFGDGSRIEGEEMREVRRVYEEEAVDFGWEEGDVLMVENMLVGHGRRAYSGGRRVMVTMGDMFSFDREHSDATPHS